ncbi:DUF2071 domain-containing protein [Mucilaginibacter sp. SMC90]|uniref:DUF2071 domain-containing protein n=1 Tax=Mucilaginibacter sp. SMC90 TaxID=2929803 RepID=UPI001FB381AA|nr:DUF2071 domain-containing protein [Mucilaginibacter sp. SMC90]UOE51556.1 DUF2071 domain-containing protein [Mucilaginibacter sp. SMC90]
MKVPKITGIIDRRILINFVVDADVAKKIVPSPFTPKLINGKAIAGICLIRLKEVRPKGIPAFLGMRSENGAHRIAVEWLENGELKEGVYIPRRDTSSLFNTVAGGRFFPGKHYLAKFDTNENNGQYHVAFTSPDGTAISVDAKVVDKLNPGSIFGTLEVASDFFKAGSTGYSPNGNKYEGLILHTDNWKVQALEVSSVKSSFFEDAALFPEGAVKFDNALLMTNVQHHWSSGCDKPIVITV